MSDEYPTEAELEALKNWQPPGVGWSGSEPWLGILWLCDGAWNQYMGSIRWDDEAKQMTFATGGWSGNEDIIGALMENVMAQAMLWQSSHRGGKFIYGLRANP